LKILFITHKFYPFVGGIEVNSEILANAFYNAGEQVHLITWTKESGEKNFPFPVIRNPNLATLFQEHRWAEIVYENNPSLRLSWPAVLFNKVSVIALRTWVNRMDGKIALQDKLKILWLKRASGVIAVSEAVRRRSWSKATVIGNPYRIELFKVLPDIPRTAGFVFLGRLVSDKGADLAIKALKKIISNASEQGYEKALLTLSIVGDGPERHQLEDLVLQLGLKNRVKFTGSLNGEKLVSCLNKHRFILVPSLWEEPFGNVALEGMACGCVPIVSDGGGLPDAVGNAGITFKRGNINSLADAIANIITNPQLEDNLRSAASKHLTEHHPATVSEKYLNVIKSSLKNKRVN